MGAPLQFALERQSATGSSHLTRMIEVLQHFQFEELEGTTMIAREPIGVVGLITPWNWPINQIVCDEGAELVTGGPGRPENLNRGYFVRPTVFANVRNDMTIAREEIFGPVLTILPYRDEAEVVAMANDTVYGLAAYVQSSDIAHARRLAQQMRAGNVHLNYPAGDNAAPFGGYKQSGNGREYGKWGLEEFLEVKAVIGYEAA